ncbi:glycosyltransferase family 25-domain-containing protein [Amylostereum chailletii]|nr:glycosyltransferase family 25-domain-containing protein [Amylostereum chailletii]
MPHLVRNLSQLLLCASIALVASSLFIIVLLDIPLHALDITNARYFSSPFENTGSTTLGNTVSRVYVISLPRRTDRRAEMDKLQKALALNWTYVDAVDATDPEAVETHTSYQTVDGHRSVVNRYVPTFLWPQDIDELAHGSQPLPLSGADLWIQASVPARHTPAETTVAGSMQTGSLDETGQSPPPPLACTRRNNLFASFSDRLPPYKRLTPGKVACWHSHLQVIQDVANGEDNRPALVLEDDIDMEKDVGARLAALWGGLPAEWDIVYLGHCWSNETEHAPLRVVSSPLFLPSDDLVEQGYNPSALHPSSGPKCTHGYVLSRTGARRILLHLRHPPFAYSRAIDQALSWLVKSDRLHAFSVVPPIIVQRKVGKSDLVEGTGSSWKDHLYDPVLGWDRKAEVVDVAGTAVQE